MPQRLACKVFTATKAFDRDHLGDKVSAFLADIDPKDLESKVVLQSSDAEFHCLTIVLWYFVHQDAPQDVTPRRRVSSS